MLNDLISIIFVLGLIWSLAFINISIEIERIRKKLDK